MDKSRMNKFFLCIILLGLIVTVSAEYEEQMQKALRQADADERAGNYDAASSGYSGAASLAESDKNYDKAIEYELKSAEMLNKTTMSHGYALSYGLVAGYYSKKGKLEGVDYSDKIRENCEIEEKLLLEEIDKELAVQSGKPKPSYTLVYSKYDSLVDCHILLKDKEKTCKYCTLSNEYADKEGKTRGDYTNIVINDCTRDRFGCPKTAKANSGVSGTDVATGNVGGLPILSIGVGILVLILVGGFFLLNGKKRKSK